MINSSIFRDRLKKPAEDFLGFNATLFKAVMRASPVSEL